MATWCPACSSHDACSRRRSTGDRTRKARGAIPSRFFCFRAASANASSLWAGALTPCRLRPRRASRAGGLRASMLSQWESISSIAAKGSWVSNLLRWRLSPLAMTAFVQSGKKAVSPVVSTRGRSDGGQRHRRRWSGWKGPLRTDATPDRESTGPPIGRKVAGKLPVRKRFQVKEPLASK